MAPRTSDKFVAGRALREACILIYGYGRYVSTPDVIHYILEHGLPSRAEREAYYAARMAEVDETRSFAELTDPSIAHAADIFRATNMPETGDNQLPI